MGSSLSTQNVGDESVRNSPIKPRGAFEQQDTVVFFKALPRLNDLILGFK
jgi:hypothetical protein